MNNSTHREHIAELKRRVEEGKQETRSRRVAAGLSPEGPSMNFVDNDLSIVIYNQTNGVIPIIAKYTQIAFDSNIIVPIDDHHFDKYEKYLSLLRFSDSIPIRTAVKGIRGIIYIIKQNNLAIKSGDYDIEDINHRLYQCLKMLQLAKKEIRADNGNRVRRLQRGSTFYSCEINKVVDHYLNIEHELEEGFKNGQIKKLRTGDK